MDNVQAAIVRFINSLYGESVGIAKLAFLAEFPDHFARGTIREVFVEVCAKDYRPSGHDLGPLFAHPDLLALMMQYREENSKPNKAIWDEDVPPHFPYSVVIPSIKLREKWLDEQLESLGFS